MVNKKLEKKYNKLKSKMSKKFANLSPTYLLTDKNEIDAIVESEDGYLSLVSGKPVADVSNYTVIDDNFFTDNNDAVTSEQESFSEDAYSQENQEQYENNSEQIGEASEFTENSDDFWASKVGDSSYGHYDENGEWIWDGYLDDAGQWIYNDANNVYNEGEVVTDNNVVSQQTDLDVSDSELTGVDQVQQNYQEVQVQPDNLEPVANSTEQQFSESFVGTGEEHLNGNVQTEFNDQIQSINSINNLQSEVAADNSQQNEQVVVASAPESFNNECLHTSGQQGYVTSEPTGQIFNGTRYSNFSPHKVVNSQQPFVGNYANAERYVDRTVIIDRPELYKNNTTVVNENSQFIDGESILNLQQNSFRTSFLDNGQFKEVSERPFLEFQKTHNNQIPVGEVPVNLNNAYQRNVKQRDLFFEGNVSPYANVASTGIQRESISSSQPMVFFPYSQSLDSRHFVVQNPQKIKSQQYVNLKTVSAKEDMVNQQKKRMEFAAPSFDIRKEQKSSAMPNSFISTSMSEMQKTKPLNFSSPSFSVNKGFSDNVPTVHRKTETLKIVLPFNQILMGQNENLARNGNIKIPLEIELTNFGGLFNAPRYSSISDNTRRYVDSFADSGYYREPGYVRAPFFGQQLGRRRFGGTPFGVSRFGNNMMYSNGILRNSFRKKIPYFLNNSTPMLSTSDLDFNSLDSDFTTADDLSNFDYDDFYDADSFGLTNDNYFSSPGLIRDTSFDSVTDYATSVIDDEKLI